MNIKLIGEENDTPCTPTKDNMVIKTTYGLRLVDDAIGYNWEIGFVFPDKEKAEYFVEHFDQNTMFDYREGMLKDDYIFHIIHFKYPKPKEIYADQLRMKKDFKKYYI